MITSKPPIRLTIILVILLFAVLPRARAAITTWNGNSATTSNWTDAGNWTALPVATDSLRFGGTNRLTSTNDFAADTQFNGIGIVSGGPFVLQGNGITLAGTVDNSNVAQLLTIDLNLILTTEIGFATKVGGGDITVNGNITGASAAILATGAGIVNLSGTNVLGSTIRASTATATVRVSAGTTTTKGISAGSGTIDIASGGTLKVGALLAAGNTTSVNTLTGSGALIKTNTNMQTMAGNGSGFTGSITLEGGTMSLTTGNAIGTSTITFTGGTLLTGAAITYTTGNLDGSVGTVNLANAPTLILAGTQNASFGGAITNTGSLTKSGTATQTLTGVNTYSGATVVSNGTLLLSGSGTINSTSGVSVTGGTFNYNSTTALTRAVTVNGGTFRQNSASNYTGALTFTSGTLGGSNFSGKDLTVGATQTIAPGNSTGTMTSGAETWAGSGTYLWEINDATGAAGSTSSGWDLLSITGDLALTATNSDKFTIQVVSLTALQAPGDAQNFSGTTQSYSWLIADSTNPITTFDSTAFLIDASGFQNPTQPGSVWSVALGGSPGIGGDNSQLYLTYAVPEPSTWALLAFSLTTVMIMRRRRG